MADTRFSLQRVESEAGPLALVTIDNGADHTKPTFFGRAALESAERAIEELESGEWAGMVLTGKPFVFAAGADIGEFPDVTPEAAREGSRAGHELFLRIHRLPFPTLAAINGACLGGGVEIALHCDFRTISSAVRHFACPEVFLGLFPAWGGTQLVPRLVDPDEAVKFVVENPLRQNRMLDARKAHAAGFADALLEPAEFLDDSIAFLLERIRTGARPRIEERPIDAEALAEAIRKARSRVDGQVHGAAPAPYVALDLMAGAATWSLEDGYRAEEDAVAELLPGPQAQASIYAFDLVERRAKRGVGVPDVAPLKVEKVGIVGAGLMASQIAALALRRLEVPIVLRDLQEDVVEHALESIRGELAGEVAKGRYDEGKARFLGSLVAGTTGWDGFDDCDLVLEAVVERMDVKQQVFGELRERARPNAILATNTSSLSVAEMGADVGMHFFNPVAMMPLVELIRHDATDDVALATAWDVTKRLRKTGVVVRDAPGFVVNRVLARMTSALMDALEHGNTVEETDDAILRLGLPMAPSVLLQMVGPRVAYHTLETMHEAYPDRFPLSRTLRNYAEGREEVVSVGDARRSVDEITECVLEAMADEIRHLLDEGVVAEAADVDTCLLLGAGFPFFRGGITKHLDQTGISERVAGRPLAEIGAAAPA
ncbi:MAG TPA: 3-hydroxyacyl-CoA dehydrogenase NAD-binding domain-containing protein [Gaiellaceae bacterium]|nr:3-hydroxyacyl-CoA dehydrogenase NAD-binding domain-containing protein [Gaiellaceae bacterium]